MSVIEEPAPADHLHPSLLEVGAGEDGYSRGVAARSLSTVHKNDVTQFVDFDASKPREAASGNPHGGPGR